MLNYPFRKMLGFITVFEYMQIDIQQLITYCQKTSSFEYFYLNSQYQIYRFVREKCALYFFTIKARAGAYIIIIAKMRLSIEKVNQYQANLRKNQLHSIFSKMRYEVIHNIEKENIDQLINIPYESFTQQHLKGLIQYANQDHTNAILHLGNMVIDGMLMPAHLEGVKFKLGNNQYWCWFANVLAEAGFMTEDILNYLLERITRKKSQGSLLNALEAFGRCMKQNLSATVALLLNHEKALYGLISHIHDPEDKIVLRALELLVEASSVSEQFPRAAARLVGLARIQQAILHASMKLQTRIRLFAVQATNNFLLSGVFLTASLSRWLENALGEKDSVKLQLSYLFEAMIQILPIFDLLPKSGQVSYVLRKLYESGSQNKNAEKIRQNAQNALIALEERIRARKNINMDKLMDQTMRDESQGVTECHQMF